ncbi:MAG TPA: radical SAM protein [Desulfomonilaceae bacterium]|nr:radical SAM protein [Desulfomonilaceae bacterium]
MFGPQVSIIFAPTFGCNCDCRYCFEPKIPGNLSIDELSTIFQRTASYLSRYGVRHVDIYWQGGEIMVLSPQWCLEAGDLINTLMGEHDIEVAHFLQTNLMEYDPSWDTVVWRLFEGSMGSSLDFPNAHRRFRNISGDRYNRHWAEKFREARSRGLDVSVISVPNRETLAVSPADFYRYYVNDLGLKSIQLNTPFAAGPASRMADELLLDPMKLGDFMVGLLEAWLSNDDPVTLEPFQAILDRMTLGEANAKTPCFFCSNCVNSFFCIGPDGAVGQCDSWLGSYPERNFGNLLESDDLGKILVSPNRMKLAARTANLIKDSECLDCKYFSLCNGGCPIRTMSAQGSPDKSDPYCETYKRIFAAIEEHVRGDRKIWTRRESSSSEKSRSLVWGWPEPGAIVFSSFECTNNCIFCAPAHDRSKNPPDLDKEIFDFISECCETGVKTLFFTGSGEPTLNPSLVDYVRFAKQKGINNFYMFTNGFGITEELVASLWNAGMENFWVSIHGLGDTHDRIVRRKGSFVEAYRALTMLNDISPKRLNVNTCVNRLNLDQIEQLMDRVIDFSNVTAHCLCLPEWDGNAYVNRDKMCRLEPLKQRLSKITSKNYPLTILDNVPYCVAPHLPHIGNVRNEVRIKRRDSDDMVNNADNMGHNVTPRSCIDLGCSSLNDCVGVDRRYLEEYGEEELPALFCALAKNS